ncbi:MAG: hypothetical protein MH137_00440 [Flavobacteriales bacterium]|nr:hypothetical protein [Flavobacteriales bacterium]
MVLSEKHKIRNLILENHPLNSVNIVIEYVADNQHRFNALAELLNDSDKQLVKMSVWPFSKICLNHPHWANPYIPLLIELISKPAHPSVYRNVLRIFEKVEIPVQYRDAMTELGFRFFYDSQMPAAVRCNALTVLDKICQNEPLLSREICLYIENRFSSETPAFKSRGRKFLSKWNKQTNATFLNENLKSCVK